MKYFAAGFDAVVMRYYLTIGIVVLAFFANIPWLSLTIHKPNAVHNANSVGVSIERGKLA